VISGEWEGSYKNTDNKTAYKGTFDVPNLSEEHEPKDVNINITIKDSKQDKLKEFMRTQGVKQIREQFGKYIFLLREEFSQGLILPTKDSSSNSKDLTANNKTANQVLQNVNGNKVTNGAIETGTKIITKKLTLNEQFKCRAEELYRVFTNVDVKFIFFNLIR
jgi:activator of HSP90 ATPase